MLNEQDAKRILGGQFPAIHVTALLSHHEEAVKEYCAGNWETSMLKAGKFLEATLKSCLVYCALPVPSARQFKVAKTVQDLGNTSGHDDSIRLLIPRACIFIYDIVSNRGTRHDPDKINPNKMDASIVIPTISWILAEMVRISSGITTPTETLEQVEGLTEKKYPHLEDIDGRLYVNIKNISARELGLLLLHAHYPKRIKRADLSAAMAYHGVREGVRTVAITRLKIVVDETIEGMKLRLPGIEEAERVLAKAS